MSVFTTFRLVRSMSRRRFVLSYKLFMSIAICASLVCLLMKQAHTFGPKEYGLLWKKHETTVNASQLQAIASRDIDSTVKVVIVTISRSGSTFLAEIFNQNPDSFYLYEPMHGIEEQYFQSKNKDNMYISNTSSTNLRNYEHYQDRGALSFLRILSCEFDPLFPKSKTSPALVSFAPDRNIQVDKVLKQCLPQRDMRQLGSNHSGKLNSKCIELLSEKCRSSNIRAIKTIRLRIKAAEILLKADSRIFILYLTRDPRGTALSRMKTKWKELNEEKLISNTKHMCIDMDSDYDVFEKLRLRYPDRLKHIRYEDMALRPIETASDIYRVLGLSTLPEGVSTWIGQNTNKEPKVTTNYAYGTTRNSSRVVYEWKESMSSSLQNELRVECKSVLEKLRYSI